MHGKGETATKAAATINFFAMLVLTLCGHKNITDRFDHNQSSDTADV